MSARCLCSSLPERAPFSRRSRVRNGRFHSKVVFLDSARRHFAGSRERDAVRSWLGRLCERFHGCSLRLCCRSEWRGFQRRLELRGASGFVGLLDGGVCDLLRTRIVVLQASRSSDGFRLGWCRLFLLTLVRLLLFLNVLFRVFAFGRSRFLGCCVINIHPSRTLNLLQLGPHATLFVSGLHHLCLAQIPGVRSDAVGLLAFLRLVGSGGGYIRDRRGDVDLSRRALCLTKSS